MIDPATATGMAEAIVKGELLTSIYKDGTVPAEVRLEKR